MPVVINGTSGITGNTGTLISASTIGVGGATPAASGAGVTFPATLSSSTNANTLDDYEEGTWTPTWTGGTITSAVRTTYIKIGRQVIVNGNITFGSSGSGSSAFIGGLPFASDTGNESTGAVMTNFVTYPFSGSVIIYYFGGDTGFSLYASRSAGAWAAVTNSGVAGGIIIFTFTYLATN